MKFGKILSALAAVCALVIGCAKETPNVWNEIQVSSSYVGLPKDGGSKTITVTAKDSWAISDIPAWLTVSPTSGSAGETVVTFSAAKATESNENTIKLVCAGKTQSIVVKQLAEVIVLEAITVAQALEVCKQFPGGEQFRRVKGIVCKIQEIDTGSYGNATYYLSDDGTFGKDNWLEVYRGYWLDGKKFTPGDGFDVGDELVIEGNLMTYGGSTPETVQYTAYVVEYNPSLIKCDSLVVDGVKGDLLPLEGGEIEAVLTCKGNGIAIEIPDAAKSWLSVSGIQTSGTKTTVSFNAAANAGGDRNTEVTFKTTSGSKTYSAVATIYQTGAIIECSIAEFNAAEVGDTQYRVSGMVTSIAKAEYGNIYIRDWSGETYIYGIGAKGDFEKTGIKVGDIITVVGKRGQYNTTIEMLNTVVENVISVTEVDFPTFIAAEKSKDVWYRVTGTITSIAKAEYGNLYIQDEAGNEIYVYGLYSGYGAAGDARKNFLATAGIEVGDVLTVEGYKDVYNGTIELCGGVYVSHEKADTPEPPTPDVTEYSIDLAYEGTGKFYDDGVATINGEENQKVLKIGTAKESGSVTFTVPAGTTKVSAYALAWKGTPTTLVFKVGDEAIGTQDIVANDGVSGNSPYTVTVADTDKYELELGAALSADTKVTVTTAEGAGTRAIFFGIKAVK